ncbi:unnamed protein product [Parascedosporium putredinis]|uniref:NADP-dependent oxidoreductase domain-containing protein n=1 Tax=Parascedosporium putredinis TaxID=1442378 RepID=A0A9P1H0F9_9PEZI|nr:unnamed protein product [Parascedosporium putredinis]CAI7992794.1 unnamed protein product [Parascedosporium putredinis]
MRALHDLVQSGKVRYIGASSMWATEFARLQFVAESRGWTKFVSMQNHYNLLYREEEREMNRFCDDTGRENNPAAHGSSDVDRAIIRRVQEIAEKRAWPMSHVALAWIQGRVASPIVGFSSVARIEEAAAASTKSLTEGRSIARATD